MVAGGDDTVAGVGIEPQQVGGPHRREAVENAVKAVARCARRAMTTHGDRRRLGLSGGRSSRTPLRGRRSGHFAPRPDADEEHGWHLDHGLAISLRKVAAPICCGYRGSGLGVLLPSVLNHELKRLNRAVLCKQALLTKENFKSPPCYKNLFTQLDSPMSGSQETAE